MNVTVSHENTNIAIVTKVAHGLTLPGTDKLMAIYVDATGNLLPSNASLISKQKVLFVTEIIDVNTVKAQQIGFLRSLAHGYILGEYYFVTDAGDGGFSNAPGTINDICFFVFDVNTLILLDNRAL